MIRGLVRLVRFVLALVALVVLLVVGIAALPTDANAVDLNPLPDCKSAPIPERPGTGMAGWIDAPPAERPEAGDPWADSPTTTVYEQYGWAGLRWDTYDLGCGGSARDPEAAFGNAYGNSVLAIAKALGPLAVAVSDYAYHPDYLQAIDPLIVNVTTSLREAFFNPWSGAMIVGLGLLIAWKARKANMASALTAVGAALLVMMVLSGLFSYPTEAARVADGTVGAVLGPVNATLSGRAPTSDVDPVDAVAANLHNVQYAQVIRGMLGSDNSDTAEKYGPDLFRAKAISWQEDALTGDDRAKMIEDKAALWTSTAEKIEDEDPDAYAYLTGKRAEARPDAAWIAVFGTAGAVPFPVMSALLIIVGYLIVRLAVMTAPLWGTLAIFPKFLPMALGVMRVVGAALVNVVAFGVGSAILVAGITILLDPASELPDPVALLLVALLGLVMWVVLKPYRRLTQMVSNSDPFKDASGAIADKGRGATAFAKKAALAAATSGVGSYVGTKEALEDEREAHEDTVPVEAQSRPEPEPAPATTTTAQQVTPAPPVARPHGAGSAAPSMALPVADSTPEMRAAEEAALIASAARQAGEPLGLTEIEAAPVPAPAQQQPLALLAATDEDDDMYHPIAEADYVPEPTQVAAPPPVEPEVVDGEEVYVLYRPEGVEVTSAADLGADADA